MISSSFNASRTLTNTVPGLLFCDLSPVMLFMVSFQYGEISTRNGPDSSSMGPSLPTPLWNVIRPPILFYALLFNISSGLISMGSMYKAKYEAGIHQWHLLFITWNTCRQQIKLGTSWVRRSSVLDQDLLLDGLERFKFIGPQRWFSICLAKVSGLRFCSLSSGISFIVSIQYGEISTQNGGRIQVLQPLRSTMLPTQP